MAKTKPRDIFDELDEKMASRSACTCGTMLAFLVILLIFSIISSLYTIKLVMTRVNGTAINLTNITSKDVLSKLQIFVKKPTEETGVELVITEQELTVLLQQAAAQNEEVSVKGLQAAIAPEAIILSGTLTKPLTSDITVWLVPKVVNQKLEFDVIKVTAGKVTLPKILIDFLGQKIVELITTNLKDLQNLPVSEVKLNSGSMVVR